MVNLGPKERGAAADHLGVTLDATSDAPVGGRGARREALEGAVVERETVRALPDLPVKTTHPVVVGLLVLDRKAPKESLQR